MILLNPSAGKLLSSLVSTSTNVDCRVDYGRGIVSIASSVFELKPVLEAKTDENHIEGFICRKFGDSIAYFNHCNKLVGDARIARSLAALGIQSPEIATEILDDKSYMPHVICTVGYSKAKGKWASWNATDINFHNDRESAAIYACKNPIVDTTTDALCEALVQPAYQNAIGNPVVDTNGLSEIYGDPFAGLFDRVYNHVNKPFAVESAPSNDTSGADSAGLTGSTTFPSIGIRSGEHRQHNIYNFNKSRLDRIPNGSGEQRQHNVPYINRNPGYTAPMVEISTSAAGPGDYSWFRVQEGTPDRLFDDHNRSYELNLAAKDVFGVRKGRTNIYYVVDKSDPDLLFKLSEKEVTEILRTAKPYRGSVNNVKAGPTDPKLLELLEPVSGLRTDVPENVADVGNFAAFYQPSAFSRDMSIVFGKTRQDVLTKVEDALKTQQGVPLAFPFNTTKVSGDLQKALVAYKGKVRVTIAPAIVKKWVADNSIEQVSFTSDFTKHSVKPRDFKTGFRNVLKKEKRFSFVPIFKGNESAILNEVRNAIIAGYYTQEFRPCVIIGDTLSFNIKPDAKLSRLYLASEMVTPLFEKEADDIGVRLSREYGPFLQTTVHKKFVAGKNRIIVSIGARLPKASDAVAARSAKIYELTKYLYEGKTTVSLGDTIARMEALQNQMDKEIALHKDDGGSTTAADIKKFSRTVSDLDAKIKNITKDLDAEARSRIILDAPLYAVKIGNAWVTVSVIDVIYVNGSLVVKQVRAGNPKPFNTTELYTFGTHKQVV
jgi:hypothetical protein